jgi:hypothetical protein
MNISEEGKRNLLIVVVLLLSASIFFQFRDEPAPAKIAVHTRTPSNVNRNTEVLQTDLLSQEAPRFFNEKRNIFQFRGSGSAATPIDSPVPVAILKVPPKPEKPAMPDVHYLGFYVEKEKPSVRLAAISNSGNIYVGKVGDVLGGKYRVLQIEKMFLLLSLVNDDRVIRLPLGRQTGVFVGGEDSDSDDEEDSDEDE